LKIHRLLVACGGLLAQSGPPAGSLVVIGGGTIGQEITHRFLALAGGAEAPIVAIPTAGDEQDYSQSWRGADFLRRAGARNITVLHTRYPAVADSEQFTAPLRAARAVFLGGGRQWRLVDSYLGTRTQREIEGVLARGGVIGGSSAGASIQASFLVRGAREGNAVMIAPAYVTGFGYLRDIAVDQHLVTRKRQRDLLTVIDRHPQLLGIGIDEGTAIVVEKDQFEVIGCSIVAIYDHRYRPAQGKPRYYILTPGDRYDLRERRVLAGR
jgi:cyanophycinase